MAFGFANITGQRGPQGEKGETGPAGLHGASGAVGPKGAQGKSAYELAVEAGYSKSLAEFTAMLLNNNGAGGIEFPANDGKLYAVKNGAWVEIPEPSGTTDIPTPEVTQVNEEGTTNVTFFIPFKYALHETRTLLNDVAHVSWKYPFAEGRIKRVSIKAKTPGGTAIDVLVNGVTVLITSQSVTAAWKDYDVDVPILQDQPVEIFTTQSYTAEDLEVSLTFDVGNADIEFIGQNDISPNVYAVGSKASTWGAGGQASPDGVFQSIYMPSVVKLKEAYTHAFVQTADGDWYLMYSGTPIPLSAMESYPDDIVDIVGWATSTNGYFCALLKNGDIMTFNGEMSSFKLSKWVKSSDISILPDVVYGSISSVKGMINEETVKKAIDNDFYLTTQGNVYKANGTLFSVPENKKIKDIWTISSIASSSSSIGFFAIAEDNTLYVTGKLASDAAGLSYGTYNELTEIGVFDVKKIESFQYSSGYIFLLTNDGKLYFSGVQNITNKLPHYNTTVRAFTQILPNYYFTDIALCYQTLVVIAEYLGEAAS